MGADSGLQGGLGWEPAPGMLRLQGWEGQAEWHLVGQLADMSTQL